MKPIDKDALVVEIESKFQKYWKMGEESDALQDGNAKYWGGVLSCLNEVKTLINTLEVKEVDLDESARYYLLHEHISPLNEVLHQADLKVEMQYHKDIEDAYKAGIELGLKAQKGE